MTLASQFILPRILGLAIGYVFFQINLGGFLVQVQGEGVEFHAKFSLFLGVNMFSRTRICDNIRMYNPLEEIFAWMEKSEDS